MPNPGAGSVPGQAFMESLAPARNQGGEGGGHQVCMSSSFATGHPSVMKRPFGLLEHFSQGGSRYVARLRHKRQAWGSAGRPSMESMSRQTRCTHRLQNSGFTCPTHLKPGSGAHLWPAVHGMVCAGLRHPLPGKHRTTLGSHSLWMPVVVLPSF
jgi:hypothetical protein